MVETEVLIRTSERSLFKKCRRAWYWSYVDCYSTKQIKPALVFGSLVHQALATFYKPGRKRGMKPALAVAKHWKEYLAAGGEEFDVVKDVPAIDLAVEMLTNYYEEYGADERYRVIASEMTFQVDVFHPKTAAYLFTYVGTLDGVWEDLDTGELLFPEHKTGATLDPFGAPIYLDEQQGSYWAYGPEWLRAKGILKEGQKVDKVLYNRLRKAYKDTRERNEDGQYLNQNGSVSKMQPTPLFKREPVYRTQAQRAMTMRRVISEVREMELVRQGRLKVYKSPDRHCTMCEFRGPCEVHESCQDYKALLKSGYTIWDPYADHYQEEGD